MEPQTPPPAPEPTPQPQIPGPAPAAKRNVLLMVAALVFVILAGLTAFYLFAGKKSDGKTATNQTGNTSGSQPKPKALAEQVLTNPADNAKVTISQADYYGIAVGSATYYGPLLKINDAYLRLLPTAYKDQGKLIFTGKELHAPQPATFFALSNISSVRKLDATSPDDAAIITFIKSGATQSSYAYPSDKIDTYIEKPLLQAFFFKDGTVLFAKASTLQGTFLSGAEQAYYLGNADGQVTLTVAKPEMYAARTSSDLLYWQNLQADGKVAKAIQAYEKSNAQPSD